MGTGPPVGGSATRPVALVTGVGRRVGIGAAIAHRLAVEGWDVAIAAWTPYDDRMPWGADAPDTAQGIADELRAAGAAATALQADLAQVEAAGRLVDEARAALGPLTALVLCHCESVDSGLLDTTVESFDRHFAVNARASWLLVRAFAEQLSDTSGRARIVALTSDHTAGNVPYGASKGALDRIVLAAARELAHLRVSANVVNPGPIDTGWMDDDLRAAIRDRVPSARLGRPSDTADLVAFLCSPAGGWVNGQLLHSDGGLHT